MGRAWIAASSCLLLGACSNGGSSPGPTAVTPPPWSPPDPIAVVSGTWSGSVTVEAARFGRRSNGEMRDDSCLLRSGGTQPGAIDSVTIVLDQGFGRDVQGTEAPGAAPPRSLQGSVLQPPAVDYSLAVGGPDLQVRCSDGGRFRLRLESARALLQSTSPGPRALSGAETLRYEVFQRSTDEQVGWLEQVVRIHVTR